MRLERLDGIRAIAITLVLLHHLGLLDVGWAGVDLFFVLSGFLITGILRKTRAQNAYWGPFYFKRATRILPPLLLLLVIDAIFSKHDRGIYVLGYLFFLGNVVNITPHISSALGVLWSLAIEEHFYLLWPLAVRSLSRERLIQILAATLAAEPLLRLACSSLFHSYGPIYFLTPFRLDAIAFGALLALLLESQATAAALARRALAGLGLSLAAFAGTWSVAGQAFTRDANTLLFNSVGYSMVAIISFFLVAYVVLHKDALLSQTLTLRPLVFLGTISYGVYLFQKLVFIMAEKFTARHPIHPWMFVTANVVVTVGFSALSFYFYERPINEWGKRKAKQLEASALQRRLDASQETEAA